MYVMFLNLIKVNISINTKIKNKKDFGDPIDKIHLKRSEGLKSYQFRGMTHVVVKDSQSKCGQFLNIKYASSVGRTSQVRLGSVNTRGREDTSPGILQME